VQERLSQARNQSNPSMLSYLAEESLHEVSVTKAFVPSTTPACNPSPKSSHCLKRVTLLAELLAVSRMI
jgi:hypothetical protein